MRELPNDPQAERRLLACCMIDGPSVIALAVEARIERSSFYVQTYGIIFSLLVEMLSSGSTIDQSTVYQELVRRKSLSIFSPSSTFHEICSDCHTSIDAPQLIDVVSELSAVRRAIRIADLLTENCYSYKGGGLRDALGAPLDQLLALSTRADGPEPSWGEIIALAGKESEDRIAGKGRIAQTIAFPWEKMNALFGPMERGQLVVLAARTSIGKSSLARPIACHAALHRHQVYFDTLEVNPVKVALQMAATLSRIGIRALPSAHSADQQQFLSSLRELKSAGLTMSRKDRTLAQIVGRCRALSAQNKLDLVVVDHGGMLTDVYTSRDKVSEVGRITKTLKHIATELNCVVLLLWQLNRSSVKEANREPILSDLKDSGSLEEDADKVLFIHRPNEDPFTQLAQSDTSTIQDQPRFFQNIIQAKGRDEGTSIMSFYFDRATASFNPAQK